MCSSLILCQSQMLNKSLMTLIRFYCLSLILLSLTFAAEINQISYSGLSYTPLTPLHYPHQGWKASFDFSINQPVSAGDFFELLMPHVYRLKFDNDDTTMNAKLTDGTQAFRCYVTQQAAYLYGDTVFKCEAMTGFPTAVSGSISFSLSFNSGGSTYKYELQNAQAFHAGANEVQLSDDMSASINFDPYSFAGDIYTIGRTTTYNSFESYYLSMVCPDGYLLGGTQTIQYDNLGQNLALDCSSTQIYLSDNFNDWALPIDFEQAGAGVTCSDNTLRVSLNETKPGKLLWINALQSVSQGINTIQHDVQLKYSCSNTLQKTTHTTELHTIVEYTIYQGSAAAILSQTGSIQTVTSTKPCSQCSPTSSDSSSIATCMYCSDNIVTPSSTPTSLSEFSSSTASSSISSSTVTTPASTSCTICQHSERSSTASGTSSRESDSTSGAVTSSRSSSIISSKEGNSSSPSVPSSKPESTSSISPTISITQSTFSSANKSSTTAESHSLITSISSSGSTTSLSTLSSSSSISSTVSNTTGTFFTSFNVSSASVSTAPSSMTSSCFRCTSPVSDKSSSGVDTTSAESNILTNSTNLPSESVTSLSSCLLSSFSLSSPEPSSTTFSSSCSDFEVPFISSSSILPSSASFLLTSNSATVSNSSSLISTSSSISVDSSCTTNLMFTGEEYSNTAGIITCSHCQISSISIFPSEASNTMTHCTTCSFASSTEKTGKSHLAGCTNCPESIVTHATTSTGTQNFQQETDARTYETSAPGDRISRIRSSQSQIASGSLSGASEGIRVSSTDTVVDAIMTRSFGIDRSSPESATVVVETSLPFNGPLQSSIRPISLQPTPLAPESSMTVYEGGAFTCGAGKYGTALLSLIILILL